MQMPTELPLAGQSPGTPKAPRAGLGSNPRVHHLVRSEAGRVCYSAEIQGHYGRRRESDRARV